MCFKTRFVYLKRENKMFSKKEKVTGSIFAITVAVLTVILFCFFLYALKTDKILGSDFITHFEYAFQGKSLYSLVDLIICVLAPLGYGFNMVLYCLILTASKISVIFIIRWYLQKASESFKNNWKVDLVCVCLIFVEGLMPLWHWAAGNMYIGFCAPNIWHNPTIICLIPFALLSLIYIEKYYFKNEQTKKNWILLCLFLTLGTFAKPSFLIAIVPALGVMMLIDLIKQKWKNIKHVLYTALAFIPSVLIIVLQYFVLFGSDSSSGITISIGNLPVLTVPLLILTPALIYIFNAKRISKLDALCMMFYVVSFLIGFFITETGERALHGNFGWSYQCAATFLYIFSLIRYAICYAEMKKYQRVIVDVAFVLNLVCGIVYFCRVWILGDYY